MNTPTAAARLAQEHDRFRAVVDLSPDAILMHANGHITYVNDAAVRLLGAA